MEWRFFVDAKFFLFLVEEDVVVRLEERRKVFASVVLHMEDPKTPH
jgi:hypothetical protein